MIDLRKIFDAFNAKTGNRLTCKKIYIVPSMRYWFDEQTQELTVATLQLDTNPFTIKTIKFNPDLENKEIESILSDYLAQALVIGENWETYIEYKKRMKN